MKNHTMTLLFAATACTAVATNSASAATVLMDFSDGGANYDVNDLGGLVWNEFDTTVADLKDSSGASTGWTVNASFSSGASQGGGAINGSAGPSPFNVLDGNGQAYVTDDGFFSNASISPVTIAFTNLDINTIYHFSAIGGRESAGEDGVIAVTLGSTDATDLSLKNDGTVLNFSATSNEFGQITFTFNEKVGGAGSASATLNAMSMSDVPEPSTLALLGLGTMLIARRRRS